VKYYVRNRFLTFFESRDIKFAKIG
jgi:hypothetical protein